VPTTVRRASGVDAALLHDLARQTFPLACPPSTTQQAIDAFISEHLAIDSFERYLADSTREILIAEVESAR